jgi:hypothetical protein
MKHCICGDNDCPHDFAPSAPPPGARTPEPQHEVDDATLLERIATEYGYRVKEAVDDDVAANAARICQHLNKLAASLRAVSPAAGAAGAITQQEIGLDGLGERLIQYHECGECTLEQLGIVQHFVNWLYSRRTVNGWPWYARPFPPGPPDQEGAP